MSENIDLREIFEAAIELQSAEDVRRYLDDVCRQNEDLRAEVETLIRSHEEAGKFLGGNVPTSLNTTPPSEVAGREIGPYKLLQQIGEGGFGVVYMALQQKPVRREVAVKIIKPGMDTKEVIARFEAERQALALMDHPNIAKVLDAGETEKGHPFFVMELVKGVPLTEFCDRNKLCSKQRLELFITICRAVQHAHQKGIIHRDLKPSNVMVTVNDNKPVPKIIDFGVSKAISQQLTERTLFTRYGQMMGTPVYMSPEQAQMTGVDIDTRSDVYSLGILLYELLTGTTPLDTERLRQTAYAEIQRLIAEEEAPKPSVRLSTPGNHQADVALYRDTNPKSLRQFVNGDLDWIVMKAIDKDRNRRYESASRFAEDIERFLINEEVEARPPSTFYSLSKFARRNRGPVITASALLLTICLGLIGTSVGLLEANKKTELAEQQSSVAQAAQAETVKERDRALKAERGAVAAESEAKRIAEERRRLLYVANMQSAARIWNSSNGNHRQVEDLLAAWIPVDEQPDLRDFAWRYQWSQLHQNARQTIFDSHRAVFLSNGNLLISNEDGIREWDGLGGLLSQPWTKYASRARFSSNGRWAALPMKDTVQLIDLVAGTVHELPGARFTFSCNSRFIACWDREGDIPVWELRTEPRAVDPLRPTGFDRLPLASNLYLAPDGKSFLLKGHPTPWRREYDVRAYLHGRPEPVTWQHSPPIGSWAWSPDGQLIAIGILSGKVHLQHILQPEKRIIFGTHGKQITAMTFSPDSQRLATGGSDGTLDIWDIQSEPNALASGVVRENVNQTSARLAPTAYVRAPILARSIKATGGPVQSIAFSADGLQLVTTDGDHVTKRWNLVDNDGPIQLGDVADSLFGGSVGIDFGLSSGHATVTEVVAGFPAAEDGRLAVGDEIIGISKPGNAPMQSLVGLDEVDITKALLGRPGSEVLVHLRKDKGSDPSIVRLTRRPYPDSMSYRVACSPKRNSLAVASRVHGVTVWNNERRQVRRYPYRGCSVAYSSNGRYLAMDDLNQIVLWDLENDRLHANLATRRATLDEGGVSLAFSPDDNYLAAGTGFPFYHAPRRSELCVWDLNSLNEVGKQDNGATVTPLYANDHILTSVVFTPDGRQLLAADHDGVIRVWDTNSWSLQKTLGTNHSASAAADDAHKFGRATAMAISPNGNTLAVGFGASLSTRTGIVLWDMGADSHLRTISGPRPMALAFSSDGRTIVSADEGHDVILWDVATGLPLREFDSHENAVFGVDFSSDGRTLVSTDINGVLQIREAASLDQIDRHPSTLQSLFRLGNKQNRERRHVQAERTLRHLMTKQQKTLGDDAPELVETRAELEVAIKGQSKMPDRPPPE